MIKLLSIITKNGCNMSKKKDQHTNIAVKSNLKILLFLALLLIAIVSVLYSAGIVESHNAAPTKSVQSLPENSKKYKIKKTKLLIIGSGPAGYTAAVYTARANIKPILVQGHQVGGQLMITNDVENYPGFKDSIKGSFLMEQMRAQAEKAGTELITDNIVKVDFSSKPFKCYGVSDNLYLADSVIISTGAQAKWLEIPSEKKFMGSGVSGCAVCDGFFFKDKKIIIVGGGNTAAREALHMTHHASEVTIVHRRDTLRAEKILQGRLLKNPKIKFIWDSTVEEIVGDENADGVTGVRLKNQKTGKITDVKTDGVFIAIGHKPATDIFKGHIDLDKDGYIKCAPGTVNTNKPGIFAAGDVQDKVYSQAVTAAGQGCMAALDAEKYLDELSVPK